MSTPMDPALAARILENPHFSVTDWPMLVDNWSRRVFQDRHSEITPRIRALRLLEEAIELAQSEGVTPDEVNILRDQVFEREPGEPGQELAGVLVCAAGVAATRGLSLASLFTTELRRCNTDAVIQRVRTRNLMGDKIGFNRE